MRNHDNLMLDNSSLHASLERQDRDDTGLRVMGIILSLPLLVMVALLILFVTEAGSAFGW